VAKILAAEALLENGSEPAGLFRKKREVAFGAPDVTGQYHEIPQNTVKQKVSDAPRGKLQDVSYRCTRRHRKWCAQTKRDSSLRLPARHGGQAQQAGNEGR